MNIFTKITTIYQASIDLTTKNNFMFYYSLNFQFNNSTIGANSKRLLFLAEIINTKKQE